MRTFNDREIEEVKSFISDNYAARNIEFINQTDFFVKFSGIKNSKKVIFNFDKKDGFVIEESE